MSPDTLTERHLSSATISESELLSDWIESFCQQKVTYTLGTFKISVNDAPPVRWFQTAINKLIDLNDLKDNWDSEGAPSIDIDCILAAIVLLAQITQDNTPEPYIFPTLQGGVQIEWSTKKAEIEIEIINKNTILVLFDKPNGEELDWEEEIYDNIPRLVNCVKQLI
ncbi:hypothetical protein J7L05_12025 [bacterium]|nr:hypothetical protein [bacterium]